MKKHLNIILAAAMAVMAILALISFALPAFVSPMEGGDPLTLADISFGYEIDGVPMLGTSVYYVIILIAEIVGLLLLVPLFFNLKKGKMVFLLLSFLFFVSAAVALLVGGNQLWVAAEKMPYEMVSAVLKVYKKGCAMTVGGIALVVAGVLQLVYYFILRKQQKASK